MHTVKRAVLIVLVLVLGLATTVAPASAAVKCNGKTATIEGTGVR